jgi:hypothetical protein
MMGVNTGPFTYLSVSSKHRMFLSNASGMFLETFKVTGSAIIGSQLALTATAASMKINNSSSVTLAQLALTTTTVNLDLRNSSAQIDGGHLEMGTTALKINTQNAGAIAAELAFFDDESWWMSGRISINNAIGGKAAIFAGTDNASANTTHSISYGSTMATRPQVVYSLQSGSTIGLNQLTTFDTSGFTISTVNNVAVNFNYWCFRTI